jgi:DNA-binding CsgD family transcriptional regulator
VPLLGRAEELARLQALIREIDQRGTALLVKGEAGIGKSALLAELAALAGSRSITVVTAAGVESEAELSYAGLHALLKPALNRLEQLPDPQRQAISAAFGLVSAPAPDRFLIALAALELLTDLAAESSVLAILEDANWLDAASADVLAFVARRIDLEPIVLLFAVRDGLESRLDQLGLDELHVGPLAEESAHALLDAVAPDLAADVQARVLEESAGNPLALVELPKAVRGTDHDGRLLPGPLPMTERLERAFSARAHDLPPETQTLLLVAALAGSGNVAEILAAGRLLDSQLAEEHLDPAASVGLVELRGTNLQFRHPLVRSAISQSATNERRRAANAALAKALRSDPDRCVWHWAAATSGPDRALVAALEATAERASQRGAASTAMAAFERAAQLASSEPARGNLLIRAAGMAITLGRPTVAVRLLREAEPLSLSPTDRTWLLWHLEQLQPRWTGATPAPALVEQARELAGAGEEDRALQVLADVAFRCWWGNPTPEIRAQIAEAAEWLQAPSSTARLLFVMALADPVGRGREVLEQLSRLLSEPERQPTEAHDLATAAAALWADDIAARFFAAATSGTRAQGHIGMLAQALVGQAWSAFHLGKWDTASTSAAEAESLATETSQVRWVLVARLVEAALAASKGQVDRAEAIAAACEAPLLAAGANPLLALVQLVRGRSLLAVGRHREAFEELRRILDPTEAPYQLFAGVWAIVDLAEAAVHSGNEAEARKLIRPLESIAQRSGGDLLHSSLRFARAVLADQGELEQELEHAARSDLSVWPVTAARLQLFHGTWLRRHGRIAAARLPLRTARTTFEALGATPWAERAAEELRASGESPRPRTIDLRRELTAQELQIARMAAEGLTNREIGQKLFLSHRTIGTHLYRLYPKLGVTSRRQLRKALEASENR